jgi:hypothetical protein
MRFNASFSVRNDPQLNFERDKSQRVQRAATMPNLFVKQATDVKTGLAGTGSFKTSKSKTIQDNSAIGEKDSSKQVFFAQINDGGKLGLTLGISRTTGG